MMALSVDRSRVPGFREPEVAAIVESIAALPDRTLRAATTRHAAIYAANAAAQDAWLAAYAAVEGQPERIRTYQEALAAVVAALEQRKLRVRRSRVQIPEEFWTILLVAARAAAVEAVAGDLIEPPARHLLRAAWGLVHHR
jgi:hypothetical protein